MPVATMPPSCSAELARYRAQRNFNPEAWIHEKCEKLNSYMTRCGLKACITNVSGGIDSAVVLSLSAHASRMVGSPIAVNVGVCQPINSSEWALDRGRENISSCGAVEVIVDQTDLHNTLAERVSNAVGLSRGPFADGQLRSYMRTPVAYYIAQLYSQKGTPAIVLGTGNMDEDGFLGYFCKAGDGVVDVQLISDLHKSEVFKVARVLGVPERTLSAPPSADLWSGQTDEEELGFPYDFVELYTGHYLKLDADAKVSFKEGLPAEDRAAFESLAAAVESVHRRNAHKISGIVNL